MKKYIFALVLFASWLMKPAPASASEWLVAEPSGQIKADNLGQDNADTVDYRYLRLVGYLESARSPLKDYSWELVQTADAFEIDWRLVPAIAGLESSFGLRMVEGTFNAYGWAGGYYQFSNWPNSISYVTERLRNNYYNRGLKLPTQIGFVYAPPNPSWGGLVVSIMEKISPGG